MQLEKSMEFCQFSPWPRWHSVVLPRKSTDFPSLYAEMTCVPCLSRDFAPASGEFLSIFNSACYRISIWNRYFLYVNHSKATIYTNRFPAVISVLRWLTQSHSHSVEYQSPASERNGRVKRVHSRLVNIRLSPKSCFLPSLCPPFPSIILHLHVKRPGNDSLSQPIVSLMYYRIEGKARNLCEKDLCQHTPVFPLPSFPQSSLPVPSGARGL